MSILDNILCDGGPFPPDVDPTPPQCEKCGKADAVPDDEWCMPCIEEECDQLATTLVDIARLHVKSDYEWMRDLLAPLSEQEQREIIADGKGYLQ